MKCVKIQKDKKWLKCFLIVYFYVLTLNSNDDEDNLIYQIPDKSEPYNIQLMNAYLIGLMKKHLK